MTTQAQAAIYEALHLASWGGKPYVIFNPKKKPVEGLPVIFGFNNGGTPGGLRAVAIAQDGAVLGRHICSSEAYMPYDLGLVEGSSNSRLEEYKKHFPDGFRCEFVPHSNMENHPGLYNVLQFRKDADK